MAEFDRARIDSILILISKYANSGNNIAAAVSQLCSEIDRLTALLAERDAEIARLKRYVGVMDATMKIEDKPSFEVKR